MNRPDGAVTLDGVLRHWLAVLLTRGFILVAFAVAGCGGGGSASSPPVGAAVDGSADTTGDENTDTTNPVVPAQPEPEPEPEPEPTPVTVNSNPEITSLEAATTAAGDFQVTLSWQVSDADGDTVACVLSPGGGLAPVLIDNCVNNNQTTVDYAADGVFDALLVATDSQGGSASSSVNVSVSSPVTMAGVITSFPQATPSNDGTLGLFLNDQDGDPDSLTRDDMVPVEALVSLFLITDVDLADAIATVKTDADGQYEVTARDVRDYLVATGAIQPTASNDEIITAFRALGRLQVRAVIVAERDGQAQALAIQTIADPGNVDDTGMPLPVDVDPIVHRVVTAIVDQIRESVGSLQAMGLPAPVVDELLNTVVSTVVVEIDRVLAETADDLIAIPEGQTVESVIRSQQDDLALDVPSEEVADLVELFDSVEEQLEEDDLSSFESSIVSAAVLVDASESRVEASLDSESQGLISGLEAVISNNVTDTVETRIEQAQQIGTDAALEAVFGTSENGANYEQIVELAQAENTRQQRRSLQRFFLSLGLGVIVDENAAADAGVVALKLALPAHLDDDDLPGTAGLDERNIRLFKVGDGELDADSIYTSDPLAPLGSVGADGEPAAPFIYVPGLSDVLAETTGNVDPTELQQAVDSAWTNINSSDLFPSTDDYLLIDKIAILNQLDERLQHSALVSNRVIDQLIESRDTDISIKRLAAVIAGNFQWFAEDVHLTPEGLPIYSDRRGPLASGASVVDSSEIIRALSFTLGDTATSTARALTERTSFYAQFAPDAIEAAIQRAAINRQFGFDLPALLLDIYPQQANVYRDLIVGIEGQLEPAYAYQQARDRVASGLTAALPSSLFGQTLTSESRINIRAALFLMDFVLNSNFLREPAQGYFTDFKIIDSSGGANRRFVPHYNNLKQMEPLGDISVATLISELLNITEIDDGELFDLAVQTIADGLEEIPVLPELREYDVEDFDGELAQRQNRIDVSCTVERFDGQDPDFGADHQRLQLAVFGVRYVPETGEFIKGERIDASVSSVLLDTDGPVARTYTIEDLSVLDGAEYGRDYVIRFEIDGYQNELPELYFWADGFSPVLDLCPTDAPLLVGPDQQFVSIPGLSLVSDQNRPGENGDELEGIDVSNFEIPGAPLYLTASEEQLGQGRSDFSFISSDSGFHIAAAAASDTAFAPLFGLFGDGQFEITLDSAEPAQPLHDIQTLLGLSLRDTVQRAAAEPELMTTGIDVASGDVEPNRLYLMRDAEGRYWILELRFAELFTEYDGSTRAFVDIGIASVNALGEVRAPDVAFDEAVSEPYPGVEGGGIVHYRLYYGDWLILETPDSYTGPELLPAAPLAFADDESYRQLSDATDGVFIRYAGAHFDQNIQSFEDFDANFGTLAAAADIPIRIDAGRAGLSFVSLGFDRDAKRYLMDPQPQDAGSFTTNLSHNDLVAIFDDNADDDGPVYLARVIRDLAPDDPYANFEIGLEVIRFDVLTNNIDNFDEREVVCFADDRGGCPDGFPELAFASDVENVVGVVFDRDFDGLPAIFDLNDQDPNIPGQQPFGPIDGGGEYIDDVLSVQAAAELAADGSVREYLAVETVGIYPGEVAHIALGGALFSDTDEPQIALTCEPGQQHSDGQFLPFDCQRQTLPGGVVNQLGSVTDYSLGMELTIPQQTLDQLGERVAIAYEIVFSQPLDANGTPFLCGDSECPARPPIKGTVSVTLPGPLPVIGDLTLISADEFTSIADVSSIDVNREVLIVGAAVPGAREYELTLVCAATGPDADYLPDEHFSTYAPAIGDAGQALQPEFLIHAPWLAGRSCDLTMRTRIENEAGDIVGLSVFRSQGIRTTETVSPVSADNEIALLPGDSLCLTPDGRHLYTDFCEPEQLLFSYQGPGLDDASVVLGTGPSVLHSMTDSENQTVLQGQLFGDAFIAFDTDSNPDDFLPVCGAISSDPLSDSCDYTGPVQLADVFVVDPDLTEMVLLPHLSDLGLQLLGNLNADGNIPLQDFGEYWLQVPDTQDLLEISVEVYADEFTQDRSVYARFKRQTQATDSSAGNGGVIEPAVPGYVYLEHQSGVAADVELRFVEAGAVHISWYLIDSRPVLSGRHDFNGDGIDELDVFNESGRWFFTFDNSFSRVEQVTANGIEPLALDADGFFLSSVDEQQGFAEFLLQQTGTEYLVRAEFGPGGGGYLDVVSETVVDESAELLFDGMPAEHYFPQGVAVASPFDNDAAGNQLFATQLSLFDDTQQPTTIDPAQMETRPTDESICADGSLPFDNGACADGSLPFPVAPVSFPPDLPEPLCADGSLAVDGSQCTDGASPFAPDVPIDSLQPLPTEAFICDDPSLAADTAACADATLPPESVIPVDGSQVVAPQLMVCSDGSVVPEGVVCPDGLPPIEETFPVDGSNQSGPNCLQDSTSVDGVSCVNIEPPIDEPLPTDAGGEAVFPEPGFCADGTTASEIHCADLNPPLPPIDAELCIDDTGTTFQCSEIEPPIESGSGAEGGSDFRPSETFFCDDGSVPSADGFCADGQQAINFAEPDFPEPNFPAPVFPDSSLPEPDFPGPADEVAIGEHIEYDPFAVRGPLAIRLDAERIATVLAGRARVADLLDAGALRASSSNADCFGPQLLYQNHPDDRSGGSSGVLPSGDLGIWAEFDFQNGEVCAAAQLNAQLKAARRSTFAGLLSMAATVRQLDVSEQRLLLDGGAVSVAGRMQGLGIPDVEFLDATVQRSADTGIWRYSVSMMYFDALRADFSRMSVALIFDPGELADRHDYAGLLQISADDQFAGGNCPDSSVRHLSSLAFERIDQDQMRTEYRYGVFCGDSASGSGFGSDGRVDPSYSQLQFADGWGNNFSIFSANFNPANNSGSYAYSWQAGPADSHSRVLNAGIVDSDPLHGDAWYGYGESLTNSGDAAGTINGFICNWAGPGASHELTERAQYQSLQWDDALGLFGVGEGGSNITYAPTASCVYDSDDGGSFLYDRNLNGDLSDESSDTVDVGDSEVLPFDLAPPAGSAFDTLDIEEVIAVSGYQPPAAPVTPVP